MKIKKAILYGALAWVLIFFEVSILMFGLKLTPSSEYYYITHIPLVAIIISFCSLLYFRKTKVDTWEGFKLGITFIIIGIILDAIITVPLFVKDYNFFLKTELLISYVIGVLITTIIGSIRK